MGTGGLGEAIATIQAKLCTVLHTTIIHNGWKYMKLTWEYSFEPLKVVPDISKCFKVVPLRQQLDNDWEDTSSAFKQREATRGKKQLYFGFLLKGGGSNPNPKLSRNFSKKRGGESNPNLMRNFSRSSLDIF